MKVIGVFTGSSVSELTDSSHGSMTVVWPAASGDGGENVLHADLI